MKKTLIALILCMALVMCMLAGCSDKAKNDEEVNTPVSQDTPVNTPQEDETDVAEPPVEDEKEEQPQEQVPVLDEKIALDPEDEETVTNDLGFENLRLLAGVANALGKTTAEMTQQDIDSVKYLASGPETTGDYTVYVGLMEYAVAYANEMLKEEPSYETLNNLVKMSIIKFDENDTFADLAKFGNIEIFEYYNIPVSDVSFVKAYDRLAFGYFNNNGITDVSSLADYNPETLRELDFTGNNITDWSPLEHIKKKVIVHYETQVVTDDNGKQMYIPFVLTLEEKLEQDEQAAQTENAEQPGEEQEEEFIFSADDFESLFD